MSLKCICNVLHLLAKDLAFNVTAPQLARQGELSAAGFAVVLSESLQTKCMTFVRPQLCFPVKRDGACCCTPRDKEVGHRESREGCDTMTVCVRVFVVCIVACTRVCRVQQGPSEAWHRRVMVFSPLSVRFAYNRKKPRRGLVNMMTSCLFLSGPLG